MKRIRCTGSCFQNGKELIEDEPEYAYRAFIDYVTFYKRDLKYALQCYLDSKEAFQDADIEGFLELELMVYSNSFNEPERFEIERKQFVEKGLIAEEQYHRVAFIAYIANLNENKASEHNSYIRKYPHYVNPKTGMLILSTEEIHFLNWIGAIQPGFFPHPDSMIPQKASDTRSIYETEKWYRPIDKCLQNQISVNRIIAIDAWGLYQLADLGKIDQLNKFDSVFVSHTTIIRLLEELSRTNNTDIRKLLDYLKNNQKVRIHSAGFKAQLEVRNVANYFESASAVAVCVEQDCLAILGEPSLDKNLIDHFGGRIIRVSELDKVIQVL